MTTSSPPTASPRRKGLVIALVVAVVLAGVAVTVLAMALLTRDPLPAAGADVSPTPTTTGGQPTLEPSLSAPPEATPDPTPAPLASDTLAVVAVNELNLREAPTSTAKSLGHLSAGHRVFVVEGPKQAEGYGWYRVATVDDADAPAECFAISCPSSLGWVAGISDAQDAWLMPDEVGCAPDPGLKAFARLAPLARLACYRDQTLTLRGVVWQPCCGYVGAFLYEPSWLSWPSSTAYLKAGANRLHDPGGLLLRFDPRTGPQAPEYADIVRVTGHMDDPAAHTCTITVAESALYDDPTVTVDPQERAYAPIGCRTEFVVDAIEILGNTGQRCLC
jgi:SH3 domain-containing protein